MRRSQSVRKSKSRSKSTKSIKGVKLNKADKEDKVDKTPKPKNKNKVAKKEDLNRSINSNKSNSPRVKTKK